MGIESWPQKGNAVMNFVAGKSNLENAEGCELHNYHIMIFFFVFKVK